MKTGPKGSNIDIDGALAMKNHHDSSEPKVDYPVLCFAMQSVGRSQGQVDQYRRDEMVYIYSYLLPMKEFEDRLYT